MSKWVPFAGALALLAWAAAVGAQRGGTFQGSMEDPAIAYTKAPVSNVVADLNTRLADSTVQLRFDGRAGYLQSALDALNLSVDSQLLLFSQTSLQAPRIGPANPRALFFNDRVALGWVRDGDVIEVAAHDTTLGTVFYTLDQKPGPPTAAAPPQFRRAFVCLGCHVTSDTLGVPGLLNFSTTESGPGSLMRAITMDHRTPLTERWGGWLVTGGAAGASHRGNGVPALEPARRVDLRSVDGLFEPEGYRAATSDVAALLVFSHHTTMMNLLTRLGWEARAADPRLHPSSSPDAEQRVADMMRGIAAEVVDYMLFVDEAPLPGRVQVSSGFVSRFSTGGPRDTKGRSLHELDLTRRLLKYPCSYLIYSPAFDALPPAAKEPVHRRLWEVLSGRERAERYRRALSREDRQAIVEILRDTKKDLPEYFQEHVSR